MRLVFADCELDTDRMTLRRSGDIVSVEPQVFDLIGLLARNADRVVTRDEIVEVVWGGRIVSESAISARIAAARKAVGDNGKRQGVIRTVARRGLQLVAEVATADTVPPSAAVSTASGEAQRTRYARSATGKPLAWAVIGAGPPVLRIDFMGRDLEDEWSTPVSRQAIAPIIARHRLLRFDAAGIGQSRPGVPEADIGRMAEDALAVADAAGWERFAILAESAGSAVAFTLAARWPERVTRLASVGGYARGPARRGGGALSSLAALVEESWTNPSGAMASAHLIAYLPDGPMNYLHLAADQMRRATSPEVERMLRDLHANIDVTGVLRRVACPTCLIHSRHDRVHPLTEAQICASAIPDAELVVLETANHMPNPFQPAWDVYLSVLLDFLAGNLDTG